MFRSDGGTMLRRRATSRSRCRSPSTGDRDRSSYGNFCLFWGRFSHNPRSDAAQQTRVHAVSTYNQYDACFMQGRGKPLQHEHDLMRRRLECELRLTYNMVTGADNPAEMLGPTGAVEYLQAIGAGEFDKDLPDARLTKVHEKILPELANQLLIMNVLKPGETA